MRIPIRIISLLLVSCFLICSYQGAAQKKHKTVTTKKQAEKKKKEVLPAPDTVKPESIKPVKKRDTIVIFIDSKGKETQIAGPKREKPKAKDTVILLGKGSDKPVDSTAKKVKVVMVNPECQCMTMKVNAPDTLGFETYINYTFSFKNNCKETIWINSGYFSFFIFNPNGTPAKVLRKLQYVKRYNYPEYVPLKPGTSFDFRFGDDPFFEYDLHRGFKYKFVFLYNNKTTQRKNGKTYLCSEIVEKMLTIK